jgi:hypothetical protein
MSRISIYSPKQVLTGSLLGGPIAAVYFLRRNFQALGNPDAARRTLWWGIVFNIAVTAAMPFLPDRFPNYVLPLAYSWAAHGIAASKQLSKETIASSPEFSFQSNWRVVGLAIVFLVATVAMWLALFFLLAYFNVGNLA